MKIPPLFLIEAVGNFWAWAITIFVVFWVVALVIALVTPVVKWAANKLFFAVGFVLFSPLLLAGWVWGKLRKKREQKQNYAKSKVGRAFEVRVGKLYESRGYEVEYRGIEKERQDGGIDLVAKKPSETILIQCKYWKSRKIDHLTVRSFFGDCFACIWRESIPYHEVRCIMAIPSRESLDFAAKQRFIENSPKMRYEVIGGQSKEGR